MRVNPLWCYVIILPLNNKISFQKILNILREFDEEIAHQNFSSVIHHVLNFIQDRLDVRRASIALLQEEAGGFLVYDAVMDIHGIESGSFLSFDKTMLWDVIKSREPLYRPDIRKWKPEYEVDRILLKAGIRTNFSIPLIVGGQSIGILNAGAMEVDGIGEEKRLILQLLAPRLAQVIQTIVHGEALRESKELLQSTISSMDDLVFIFDKDLCFLEFYQPAKTGALYLPPEAFIGRHINSVGLPVEVVNLFYGAIESLKISDAVQEIEYSLPFPDGTRQYSAKVSRRTDGKGKITGFTTVARDITEQKHAERALRENEKRYRHLVENIEEKHFIYIHDINGVFTYLSPSIKNILGYTPQEFMTHYTQYLTPNPVNREVVRHTELSIKGIKQPSYEVEIYCKDGYTRWLEVNEVPVFDANGSVLAVQGIAHDITERKRAEEAVRESEKKYSHLFENLSDAAFLADAETGIIIEVNRQAEILLGRARREIVGMHQSQLHPPEKADEYRQIFAKHVHEGYASDVECEVAKQDGTIVFVAISASTYVHMDRTLILGLFKDITERRKAKNKLKESEERYKKLISSVTDYIFTVEVNNGQPVSTKHGPGCLAVTGYSPEEFDTDPYLWYRMVYEDDRERVMKHAERVISGESHDALEHRITQKNGNVIWVRNTSVPNYDYGGRLIAYDGLIEDITERKKAEEALFETEERLRAIFNNTAIGIALATPQGIFVEANPTFIVMFGYPEEEINGLTINDITHPDDRELTRKFIEELFAGQRHYYQFEKRYVRKTGGVFWGRITASLIKDRFGAPKYIIGAVEDITARKSIEEEKQKLHDQFVHAQKMEAVGLLAGGVAHDFNNILTAIVGYANIVKMKIKKDDPLKINLDHIINSSLRGAHLTQSLLTFSRKQPISPRAIDLNVIIRNIQKLLSRMISEDIETQVMLDERPLTILADSGQIEQILMNLATNARDAMPLGGALTIRTEMTTIDEQFKKEHGFGEPGRYALLAITDTGVGMDEKTKERIFEPFFTTKEVGRGTGLGLAMVYGAIKQNKGYIIVSSVPGKGTTFNIYFPLIAADTRGEKADTQVVVMQGGKETVLLAEDDESLRKLISSILSEFGYTVTEAKDGVEAVDKFIMHKEEVKLVILDVVMPRKNGREAYREIIKINPLVKTLFISGHTAEIVHASGILDLGVHYLPKPIIPEQMLKKVRDILDERVS
jgi:PAS domain S-box-containing protein